VLIPLSLLLLVVAVRVLKKQQHAGTNIVALVTAVSALAMTVGGIVVVSDTYARPGPLSALREVRRAG